MICHSLAPIEVHHAVSTGTCALQSPECSARAGGDRRAVSRKADAGVVADMHEC